MTNKQRIPYSEYSFTFSRSSGAGGQNVNKVNSRVTMTWDLEVSDACNIAVKKRFKEKYKRFMVNGLVVIHSQKHRGQKMNIDDCIEKLEALILTVLHPVKMRRKTKPTKSSTKKRLDSKTKQSRQKKLRTEKF
jgi:ribosome-associated protein